MRSDLARDKDHSPLDYGQRVVLSPGGTAETAVTGRARATRLATRHAPFPTEVATPMARSVAFFILVRDVNQERAHCPYYRAHLVHKASRYRDKLAYGRTPRLFWWHRSARGPVSRSLSSPLLVHLHTNLFARAGGANRCRLQRQTTSPIIQPAGPERLREWSRSVGPPRSLAAASPRRVAFYTFVHR